MQGGRAGYPWRVNHGDPAVLSAEPCKRRQQQAKFTAAGRSIDEFRNRAHWPATARQCLIQAGMAGAERVDAMCDLLALPQQRVK